MNSLFSQPLTVVNAGLNGFADNIKQANGSVIPLVWQPPVEGNIAAGLSLAELLNHPLVEQANEIAFTRYLAAQPVLVDVLIAAEAIPALQLRKTILHSGPPIAWEKMCGPVQGAILGAVLY